MYEQEIIPTKEQTSQPKGTTSIQDGIRTHKISDEDLRKIKIQAGNDSVKNDELLKGVLNYLNESSVSKLRKTAGKRPYIAVVIAAQNRASRDIASVSTICPGTLPQGADGIHFSSEGYVTLGKFTASAVEESSK